MLWDIQVGKQHLDSNNPKSVKQYPNLQQKNPLSLHYMVACKLLVMKISQDSSAAAELGDESLVVTAKVLPMLQPEECPSRDGLTLSLEC